TRNSSKKKTKGRRRRQKKQREEVPIVISLTSIPSRLNIVHIVIRSLLNQDVRPKKIILWLNNDLIDHIPYKLKKLEGNTFEIGFSELTCSHRKLVHALETFPKEIIVTCDDDLIYTSSWLRRLYQEHKKNGTSIIANQTRYISYDEQGTLLPYRKWVYDNKTVFNKDAVLPIGAGGVLYPVNSLFKMVCDRELFLKLTPKADDLWFKAMSFLQGTTSITSKNAKGKPVPILGSQWESLKKSNVDQDKNRVQWNLVAQHFDIDLYKN
ncbi:MAG: glycosyltransferase, partial [Bacteroidota bacterium]